MKLYLIVLPELFSDIQVPGGPLTFISDRIVFERTRPVLSYLYEKDMENGGRPNYDPILIVKILLLQQ